MADLNTEIGSRAESRAGRAVSAAPRSGDLMGAVVPVRDLVPYPGNPRRGDVPAIRRSLEAHGQYRPLVVTTQGGGRIATATGAGATGEGGDIIIIDDPHKLEDANSPAARHAGIDWFEGTVTSRLNNPRAGAIILICQRIHQSDLSGRLIETGDWTHLCLAAQHNPRHPYRSPQDPRQHPNEPLWPNHQDTAELEQLKRSMGSWRAAGQLQQLPAPADGAIFKREWFRWYRPEELPPLDELLISCDLAFTDTAEADYTVLQAWGYSTPNCYLLDQIRDRLSFPETLKKLRELCERTRLRYGYQRHPTILVEQAANGHALIQTLTQYVPNVIPITPRESKIARAHNITPTIEAGNVYLPGDLETGQVEPWVQNYLLELTTFPYSSYDDQTDATAHAITRLTQPGPRLRFLG